MSSLFSSPRKFYVVSALLLLAVLASPIQAKGKPKKEKKMGGSEMELKKLDVAINRLVPVELTANLGGVSAEDKQALEKIIDASRYLDALYVRQVWSGNEKLLHQLEADTSPVGKKRLEWFRLNVGPWSRLDRGEAFIAGVPKEKPPQAGFYPDDMTKEEFDLWVKGLSPSEHEKATGFFTVIQRTADGKLKAVPYSEVYREFLEPAAARLKEAANLTTNPSLKKFLNARAEAFSSNDYYASDVAWMDVDAPLEVTIGPYEVYEDEMFNAKAAFESFVAIRDESESSKLAKFGGRLQDIENHLPMDDKHKNPKLGEAAPIRVVDEVFTAGDARRGVATAAYNLPNDERVVKEKGSKRVMLKNVQEAKFDKVLKPIADKVLSPADIKQVAFDPFFTHILMHELMHGLGPHNIKVAGKETTVRGQLKELYSAIEEAKADITGLWAMQYLIDQGGLEKRLESSMYTTYLASTFRSVRFGLTEAHGKGVALQFNYLTDEGAISYDKKLGTFRIETAKVKAAVEKLTRELLTIEAEGSYDKAKALLTRYAVMRPEMQHALDGLQHVPVDIAPHFPLGDKPVQGTR